MQLVNNTLCGNKTSTNSDNTTTSDPLKAFGDLYSLLFNVSIDFDSCINSCSPPCVEYAYDTSVSTSGPSPSVGYQKAFYESYIADTSFADKFSDYKGIIDAFDAKSISEVRIT
jgi:hypothetical protein